MKRPQIKLPLIAVAAFATWWTYSSLMNGMMSLTPGGVPCADSSKPDVLGQILHLTGEGGVNLCLDTVGGDLFPVALASLAPHGRLTFIIAQGDGNVGRNQSLNAAPQKRHFSHQTGREVGVFLIRHQENCFKPCILTPVH